VEAYQPVKQNPAFGPIAPLPVCPFCFAPRLPRGNLSGMKVREVLRLLQADGWYRVRARGGHRQFKHPTKPVAGKPSHDLPPGTLNSILKQAGLQP
jgi:predicted RNA binding protein YcfA (HicA-like mRNA interferase family)